MSGRDRREERTGFQEGRGYEPRIDLHTDFVMVYGIGEGMTERIRKWQERGYVVHLMTGVAWGQYQAYLNGEVDGRTHWDEAQTNRRYDHIIHGTSEDIPYMVPTLSYAEFLTNNIRIAVDAGVEAIHLEEPEFWVEGGYEESFKREWEIYYHEPWQAPHESEDAQYRASRLKAYLYTRCLERVCGNMKEYAKVKYNRDLRFYVPTHSLINYTQWRIVSPESRLLDLPAIDGYIAQVWTGTARTPNVYEGVRKERTFETAFLEYGIMQELVRGTSRRMWFLHDPIEDDPLHSWKEYRSNYFKTVVASLLHPHVSRFEVCPWPGRIFRGKYKSENGAAMEEIPAHYATTLLVLMHTLGNMDQKDIHWGTGNTEMGILLADSAMYQRTYPSWEEQDTSFKYDGTVVESAQGEAFHEILDWSSFYGLALPLLKHGVPARPVQLDNVRRYPGYLDDYRVLILSYEYMKPEYPDLHQAIAQWVREGGALVYVGDGSDTFHNVREWWNQGKKTYANPAEHLFESLGLARNLAPGVHSVGRGVISYLRIHPAECAHKKEAADELRLAVRTAIDRLAATDVRWTPSSAFILHRGPYVIVSALDEAVDRNAVELRGNYVDLFDAKLPVLKEITVPQGTEALLLDLDKVMGQTVLIAAASRIEAVEEISSIGFRFFALGPDHVRGVARFRCAEQPQLVKLHGSDGGWTAGSFEWHEESSTVLIHYDNDPDGITIEVLYR
jgi:hypothetical protein